MVLLEFIPVAVRWLLVVLFGELENKLIFTAQ
jgi:hypothetical protein